MVPRDDLAFPAAGVVDEKFPIQVLKSLPEDCSDLADESGVGRLTNWGAGLRTFDLKEICDFKKEPMVGIALSQSEDSSLIRLDGAVDITCVAELKAALLQAIDAGKEISICAEETTELNVTAFQLLWAAEREAKKLGMRFALQRDLPESVRTSLACAGLAGLRIVG